MRARVCTCVRVRVRECVRMRVCACVRARARAYLAAYVPACPHACVCMCVPAARVLFTRTPRHSHTLTTQQYSAIQYFPIQAPSRSSTARTAEPASQSLTTKGRPGASTQPIQSCKALAPGTQKSARHRSCASREEPSCSPTMACRPTLFPPAAARASPVPNATAPRYVNNVHGHPVPSYV